MGTMNSWQLLAILGLMIGVWLVLKYQRVNQDRLFVIATIRMTLQLMVMGYVLIWLFQQRSAFATLSAMSVMIGYAMWTLLQRTQLKWQRPSGKIAVVSLGVSTLFVQGYLTLVIFGDMQLANAQFQIPILGMLLANALSASMLGIQALRNGLQQQRDEVELLLMLGATRRQALQPLVTQSIETALVPTFNSMLTMGIIALPGMMTGQILAGANPVTAIMYQIAIMCGICATTAFTLTGFFMASRVFLFDEAARLHPEGL